MSLESDLYDTIKVVCPRVFPDVAPTDTVMPYVTWQMIGGESPVYLDGSLVEKRNAYIQVNVWAKTRLEANALMLQIEQALCDAPGLIVQPQSAMQAAFDEDTESRGAMQDFSIWATR